MRFFGSVMSSLTKLTASVEDLLSTYTNEEIVNLLNDPYVDLTMVDEVRNGTFKVPVAQPLRAANGRFKRKEQYVPNTKLHTPLPTHATVMEVVEPGYAFRKLTPEALAKAVEQAQKAEAQRAAYKLKQAQDHKQYLKEQRESTIRREKVVDADIEKYAKLIPDKAIVKPVVKTPVKPDLGTTDLADDKAASVEDYWKKRCQKVETKYATLLSSDTATSQLIDSIKELAPKSYDPAPQNLIEPKNIIVTSAQSAVLLFSDTHIGKTVSASQTLDFGEYNMQVFLDRLQLLQDSTCNILRDHVNCRIEELVIVMLGDMLDGGLDHGNEIDQTVTKFGQYYAGGHAIAQFFRIMASQFETVRIVNCVGNHTRWGEQRKMPTKARFSNLDMFLYAYIQSLTADIDNIEWDLNMQPFQRFEVQTSSFFAAHGDHLRGGDKALGIPSHALNRQIANITQLLDKQDTNNPDYYVYGHFHRAMQLPHVRGKIFVNGAFPGVDEYSLTNNFAGVDPEQTLMLIHPKYKAVDNWPIQLKFAEPGSSNFVLPQIFD